MNRLLLSLVLVTSLCINLMANPLEGGLEEGMQEADFSQNEFGKRGRNKKWKKKGKRGKRGRMGGGKMMREMKSFMEGLSSEDREQAEKVIRYLHTSNEIAKHHVSTGNFDEAEKVLKKRMRLVLPKTFDQAPSMIRYYKLGSKVELGKVYVKKGSFDQAVTILKEVQNESSSKSDIPDMMKAGIRKLLIQALKKAGRDEEVIGLMNESLKEAEQGLTFH